MSRRMWTAAVAAVVAGNGLAFGGEIVTLRTAGQPERRVEVLKSERLPDGKYLTELKDLATGAVYSVMDTQPFGTAKPAENLVAPSKPAVPASAVMDPNTPRPLFSKPLIGSSSTGARETTSSAPAVVDPNTPRPLFSKNLFGGTSQGVRETAPMRETVDSNTPRPLFSKPLFGGTSPGLPANTVSRESNLPQAKPRVNDPLLAGSTTPAAMAAMAKPGSLESISQTMSPPPKTPTLMGKLFGNEPNTSQPQPLVGRMLTSQPLAVVSPPAPPLAAPVPTISAVPKPVPIPLTPVVATSPKLAATAPPAFISEPEPVIKFTPPPASPAPAPAAVAPRPMTGTPVMPNITLGTVAPFDAEKEFAALNAEIAAVKPAPRLTAPSVAPAPVAPPIAPPPAMTPAPVAVSPPVVPVPVVVAPIAPQVVKPAPVAVASPPFMPVMPAPVAAPVTRAVALAPAPVSTPMAPPSAPLTFASPVAAVPSVATALAPVAMAVPPVVFQASQSVGILPSELAIRKEIDETAKNLRTHHRPSFRLEMASTLAETRFSGRDEVKRELAAAAYNDPAPVVRGHCIALLSQMGYTEAEHMRYVESMVNDDEPAVQRAARAAMAAVRK